MCLHSHQGGGDVNGGGGDSSNSSSNGQVGRHAPVDKMVYVSNMLRALESILQFCNPTARYYRVSIQPSTMRT